MIRDATVEDAPAIARIHVDTWRDAYAGIIPESFLANLSKESRQNRWADVLTQSAHGTIVITNEDSGIVGWASFGPSRDDDGAGTGEIYAVYLDSGHQGKGYGRKMMAVVEDRLLEMSFTVITLWVFELNSRARRFYQKAGYAADGTRKTILIGSRVLIECRYRKNI